MGQVSSPGGSGCSPQEVRETPPSGQLHSYNIMTLHHFWPLNLNL